MRSHGGSEHVPGMKGLLDTGSKSWGAGIQSYLPPLLRHKAPSWEVLHPPGSSMHLPDSVPQAPPCRSGTQRLTMLSLVPDNQPYGAKGRIVLLESYPNHLNRDMNSMARHFQICWMSEVFFEIQLLVQVLQESTG